MRRILFKISQARETHFLALVLVGLSQFFCSHLWAQEQECQPIPVPAVGDSFQLSLEDFVGIRVDIEGRDTEEVACVNIERAGFYRIFAGVTYSKASKNQTNESYYMTIKHPDENLASACDPNAGSFKIIQDIPESEFPSQADFDTTRDSGVFYFPAGENILVANHYFKIQNEHPEFLNPPNVFIKPEDVESVDFFEFVLVFVADNVADLSLSKTAGADTVNIDDPIHYELRVENLGANSARNIVLSDKVSQTTDVSLTDFNIQPDTVLQKPDYDEYIWNFDSLETDSSKLISYKAAVNPETVKRMRQFELINTSAVTSPCDANLSNNFDTTEVVVLSLPPLTDISLSQSVKTDSFSIQDSDTLWFADSGETYLYIMTITNEEDIETKDVSLTFILPDSVHADGFSRPDTLKWPLGNLPAFADTTVTVHATVSSELSEGLHELTNSAFVEAENEDPNKLENNIAVTTVYSFVPKKLTDLSIVQTVKTDSFAVEDADTVWYVRAGETYSYSITVTNQRDVLAEDVVVQDILPDSVHIPESQDADTLKWHLGTVSTLADTTLTFEAIVSPNLPAGTTELTNTALVEASNEDPAHLSDNLAITTIFAFVKKEPNFSDLAIRQSARTDSFTIAGADTLWFVDAGEIYSYLLTVTNKQNTAAEDVVVKNILSDSVQALTTSDDTLQWRLGTLPSLTDTTLVFDVRLSPNMPVGDNEVVNTALVQAKNEDPEELEDNIATLTIFNVVSHEMRLTDLSVSQQVRIDSFRVEGSDTLWFVRPGEMIEYFITVKNEENVEAQNVIIKDIPPDSVQVEGFATDDTIRWHLGNLSPLSQQTVSFQARISENLKMGTIKLINTAFVEANNEDQSKLANNISLTVRTVITIPRASLPEGCEFFTLDHNVFEPATHQALRINFELETDRSVSLELYDVSGYRVTTLANHHFDAGSNTFDWDGMTENGQKVGSGVYIVALRSNDLVCWKKVIVVR